eukprot:1145182-Pelagomonas_calceolata.AAC.1
MTFWKRAYKASGYFKAGCMRLIVEGSFTSGNKCNSVMICISQPVFSTHMGFQSILKVLEVLIGNRGGRFRCTQSCLFPIQPSNIVERVATWASARDTGISQIVHFEASLVMCSANARPRYKYVCAHSKRKFHTVPI